MLTRVLVGATLSMFMANIASTLIMLGEPAPGPRPLTVTATLLMIVVGILPVITYYRCARESEHKHRWWVAGPIMTILTLSTITALFTIGVTPPAEAATYGWGDVVLAVFQTLIIGGPLLWLHLTKASSPQVA